jgi:hypothetical protein
MCSIRGGVLVSGGAECCAIMGLRSKLTDGGTLKRRSRDYINYCSVRQALSYYIYFSNGEISFSTPPSMQEMFMWVEAIIPSPSSSSIEKTVAKLFSLAD